MSEEEKMKDVYSKYLGLLLIITIVVANGVLCYQAMIKEFPLDIINNWGWGFMNGILMTCGFWMMGER